jgi:hypothetical protein
MSLTYLGSATGRRIGELEIALRIVQQAETLCLELGNKNGLQRSERNALSYAFIGGWRVLRPEPRVECKCKEFGRK